MSGTEPTVPELPYVDAILELAKDDIDAARNLVQRLLAVQDALLASAATLAALLLGLSTTMKSMVPALVAIPIVLMLGYTDTRTWVHFRRASGRLRMLERLVTSYTKVLRESEAVRPMALSSFKREVRQYSFGTEQTFEPVTLADVWQVNKNRLRAWLYVPIVVACVVVGLLAPSIGEASSSDVCFVGDGDAILRSSETPTPLNGTMTVVPCPEP